MTPPALSEDTFLPPSCDHVGTLDTIFYHEGKWRNGNGSGYLALGVLVLARENQFFIGQQ
jgi:hypothetical protein